VIESKQGSVEAWLQGLGAPAADRDYKPGHARMLGLLDGMQLCRPALRIRVAGTNGKGSTSHMLAEGLGAAGLKVGLYTSPHIHHFNERIRIAGQPVSDAWLLQLLPPLVQQAMRIGASYFEVATALALQCFSNARVDVEILEAGVGARLDATTAVAADMALLTPVALDHQAWLGDSLEDIAAEKAHVFDGCRFRLSAAQDAPVRRIIDAGTTDVSYVGPGNGAEYGQTVEIRPAMPGAHQQGNAALALAAIDALQKAGLVDAGGTCSQAMRKAVSATVVAGRLQQVRLGGQHFWLDAAHNRHALDALMPELRRMAPFDAVFVFTREDRDLRDALGMLRELGGRLISGSPSDDADVLHDSIGDALDEECRAQQGRYLILGSFITVAAALAWVETKGGHIRPC